MADPKPQADLFSVEPDGTKTDVWIMEELLGDDDLDDGDYTHVLGEDDDDDDVELATRFTLDKDEHGYGSYPRSERIQVGGREIAVTHSKRAERAGDVLVPVDVTAFDKAWAQDTGFHLDPSGSNRIGTRYERVGEFLKTTNQMDAAEVTVREDGRVGFTDGRHRMAYLRDHGVTRVPVSMTKESLVNAKRHGLLATTHLSYRERLALLLGGEGSGNFGHAGRPGEVGGSMTVETGGGPVSLQRATEADAAQLKALRVPPKWTDVHLSEDPEADLQAVGTDVKGRTQYLYSAKHSEKAAAEKFERLKEFHKELPQLREQIQADLTDTSLSPEDRDAAVVLHLIDKTGFRIGSNGETGGDKKAYGASTLRAGHVTINGDKISFRFQGKHGVDISKTITDPVLAKELAARKATVGRGPLFPGTSDAAVRDYLHERDGDFKVKDFRSWHGTDSALRAIAKMPVPKDDKAFKKAQREVAKVVAKHLGNTPAVAMKSYIDPAVWSAWKAAKK